MNRYAKVKRQQRCTTIILDDGVPDGYDNRPAEDEYITEQEWVERLIGREREVRDYYKKRKGR